MALSKSLAAFAEPRRLFELSLNMIIAAITEGMMHPFSSLTDAPSAAAIAGTQISFLFQAADV